MKNFLKPVNFFIAILAVAAFLRLYNISHSPVALFGDELDLGYQAYSILKTGKDYRGNFMPLNFHSIAEWRSPLYLYSSVPSVALFGISPLGVRLPAAVFGVLGIWAVMLLVREVFKGEKYGNSLALIAGALLSISPWSLQYSRAGFEVTEMVFFLIMGIYFFIRSLSKPNYLWLAVVFLFLTPWIYSTAKLFTPLIIFALLVIYRKELAVFRMTHLTKALVAALIIGVPLIYGTFYKGGTQRISDISIFTDPNMEQAVGAARNTDTLAGSNNAVVRLVNNKFTYFGGKFIENYMSSFSTEFLFLRGDINMRQSVGMGEMYVFEIIPLIAGIGFLLFGSGSGVKIKSFLFSYLILAPVPSALTLNGGTHATRLFLMLPVVIIVISLGWLSIYNLIPGKFKSRLIYAVVFGYLVSFLTYAHVYHYSYPLNSSNWWHYGWHEAVSEIKSIESNYDKVIFSMSGEPAWIFFAANYQYDPSIWQNNYPIGRDVFLSGFGKVSHTGKYYFGTPESSVQIYGLGDYIDSRTLYLANAKEDGDDLLKSPEKTPPGLKLVKTIVSPKGAPLMYLFAGTK